MNLSRVMSLDLSAAAQHSLKAFDAVEPVVPHSLDHSLGVVEGLFGIDRILSDFGRSFVASYYRQSLPGYSKIYNPWQCMHVALQDGSSTEQQAFFAQARAVSTHLSGMKGQRVLELGCGLGANTLYLAERHPDVEFVGIDLMPEHVTRATEKARNLANASFRAASFEALPDDLGSFDAILAVETLCYATDLDRVAAQVARHLRPGGHMILFDAHRKTAFDTMPEDVVTATRLYEITTAVTRGFHVEGAWEQAFAKAGLDLTAADDVTWKTLPGLSTLHRRSMKAYTSLKWRLALRLLPRHFARNTVAGLLGYHVCFGSAAQPDPERGAIRYQKVVVRRPRS